MQVMVQFYYLWNQQGLSQLFPFGGQSSQFCFKHFEIVPSINALKFRIAQKLVLSSLRVSSTSSRWFISATDY